MEFPREVMFEATNYCNNRCFFCGSTVSERSRGIIDSNLMFRLIDEAYREGARRISFHGMGEPLLCKELALYVDRAKKDGFEYIYLDTNGVLANPSTINPVLDAGLDSLKFSIHAATKKTYERITGNKQFEDVVSNFTNISAYIRRHNLNCKLIAYFAESTINENELEDFKKIFQPYASEIWVNPIHNGSGMLLENRKYAVSEEFAALKKLPCPDLNRLIINWEGDAIACCTDWSGVLVYGNACNSSLTELWNNEKINRIRRQHESVDTLCDICKKCRNC